MNQHKLYVDPSGDHFHRCEWCGQLEPCNADCLNGPFATHGPEEISRDGVLPGGHCCGECYRHDSSRCHVHYSVLERGLALNKETP
jgi:hypothetical protein